MKKSHNHNNENHRKPLILILEANVDYRKIVIRFFFKFGLYPVGTGTIK